MANRGWISSFHAIEGCVLRGDNGVLLLEKGHRRADELFRKIRAAQTGGAARVEIIRVERGDMRRRTGDESARIAAFQPDFVDTRGGGSPARRGGGFAARKSSSGVFDLKALAQPGEHDVVVALDQITDPHNVGAIIRSADRFGARAVIYPNRGSGSANDTVMSASAGAAGHLPHGAVVNLARALGELKQLGYWVYAADAGGTDSWSATINFPAVLVLGSEGQGLRRNVLERCDGVLTIPGEGFADSLNVSVAAGVLLYELRRRGV